MDLLARLAPALAWSAVDIDEDHVPVEPVDHGRGQLPLVSKGILQHLYRVDIESITWVLRGEERWPVHNPRWKSEQLGSRKNNYQVLIDGEDIVPLKGVEIDRVRRKFGMVFQNAALFDSMTVGDNVVFPLPFRPTMAIDFPRSTVKFTSATAGALALA